MSVELRRLIPEDLYQFVTVSDPQISPDGELIAFVHTEINPESKEPRSSVWVVPAAGGTPVQFTRSKGSDNSPRWSPDSRTLAFLSDRGGDSKQVWAISRYGGEARQVTFMRHGAANPVWAPDGKRIAFISAAAPDEKRELLTRTKTEAAKKAEEKEGKDEARVFTRMAWRADSVGIRTERKSQIWYAAFADADHTAVSPVQVTWGTYDHANPQWSPDGALISFSAKRYDDEHLRVQEVYVAQVPAADSAAARAALAPLAPGAKDAEGDEAKAAAERVAAAAKEAEAAFQPTCVTGKRGAFGGAKFSPDGKTLAILGHLNEFDNATQARIWLFPVSGGEPRELENWDLAIGNTINADVRLDSDGVDVTWAPDGNMIYVPVSERGACVVYGFPVVGGRPTLVAGGKREIFAGTFDRNCETLAFAAGDHGNIADLYVMDCREFSETRLTDVNKELFAQVQLPEVEEIQFKARDGWDLHGWLVKPVGFEAGQRYPLVLEIHGGPHTAYGYGFSQELNLLAANGYGVLFINPRGSTSYGQEFVNAVRGDYGNRDYNDLMDAVDYALAKGWVDEKRLAVTGGSYGGFMTNWVVGHTDRFAAAITHRSICNWVSFSGTPDFGPFFNEMQHLVEDAWSPEGIEALWKISPIKYVQNVKTPISIMHSEFDFRCPIEQAEQFFMAIKYYGKAPVEFVRHPRSNHDLTRLGPPAVRVDRFHKILKWFGEYCPASAQSPRITIAGPM